MAEPAPVLGRVVAFDAERGLGLIRGDNGAELSFHATRLSDVSRFHASDLEFQRAGWPLVGIGAAALAAGAVLLVLDWKGALK